MIILFCAFSFNGMAQEKKQKVKKSDKTETLTCWASMDCEACKSKIEKNIAFEKGVKDLKVDLDIKRVYRKGHSGPWFQNRGNKKERRS